MRGSMILAAALLAAVVSPTRLVAQAPRDVLLAQLEHAATLKRTDGFQPDGKAQPRDFVIGALQNESMVVLELSLEAGTTYFIIGVCDEDCQDIDMALFNPANGETVAEDTEDDSIPMLEFTAPRTGPYYLSVTMYDCSAEFCFFGYQVLRK